MNAAPQFLAEFQDGFGSRLERSRGSCYNSETLAAAERTIDIFGHVSKFGDDTAPTKSGMKFAVTSVEPVSKPLTSSQRSSHLRKHGCLISQSCLQVATKDKK